MVGDSDESKFLQDLFPEMKTTQSSELFAEDSEVCVCVPVLSVICNRLGSKNYCVEWVGGIVCVAN